jgi:cytochrome d ubiquinol oxidase subunit I
MESFGALVTNPHVFVQFPHVITGAMATAGFFVLGISAWHLARAKDGETGDAFRRSFRVGAVYAFAATIAVMVVGHTQAQYMTRVQPMKMAAAEALWQTESPAAMSLFTWGNEPERKDVWAVKVPGLLSFLAHNRFEGEVRGIGDIQSEYEARYGPGDYVPPVKWSYWNFRVMVGAGTLMLALAAWALLTTLRNGDTKSPRLLALLVPAIVLPYVANSSGWIFTEIGRVPWIVFGVMKIENAVSPNVTVGEVLFSLVAFTLLYGALMVADVYLLNKYAKAGLHAPETGEPALGAEPVRA